MNPAEYLQKSAGITLVLNMCLGLYLGYHQVPIGQGIPLLFVIPALNIAIAITFFQK